MDARKAHKASSSSSPSSSSKRWKYQVFLSFRGEDTRKGFTGHLHAALSDAGIRAFLDDNELERAEFIKTQLEQAIDGSMISIIVFSKSYADSTWCLDELVKIMECRERLGQQVIPLFYNVDASDVRKQTGSFALAFEKHEAGICEGKHEKEKVKRWRNALTQAADLCGEDLKNADNGHEAKFIKKILGEVNKQLYSKFQLDIEHLVGITSRLNDVVRMIGIENSGSKDVVRMIGILGMGGIGKTTLATTVYNKFERIFEGRSFLANVREVIAHQPFNGLVGLQEQLLNDILKSQGIKVGSVAKGIDMIRARLCCKRALVIIDDADDLQQLKAIAGARDWFGPGSRIVITTRNKHLLEQVGVDGTYMAEEMDEKDALELFGWHAFESGYTNQEYLDLSIRVIRYCRGLPLALRVVGSFLIKRSTAEWESHLEKLQRSPDGDIQKILRISFDGLPDQEKREIFLDISCFFIGMDKDYVTQILDGCGFSATIGISVLIERCLVTVSEENELMMHDLLQDMGREIVRENGRGHPEKFSRLWKHEDITNVLSDESGTKKIEGVVLDSDLDLTRLSSKKKYLTRFSAQAFTNMKKLRLLHLRRVELTGEFKDFPKNLMWLSWHYFPLESMPDDFPMQPKLVALDLQYSELKIVWKDCKLHENLKILNLSHSEELTKSPDFSNLPNLEELILEGCLSLSEVHSSIGDLGRLSLVNLEDCKMLKDLPLNFYKSKSIETLLLNRCPSFQNLADSLGDMVSLTILEAGYTAIREIPSSIVKLKKLRILLLSGCCQLTEDAIPKDLCSLISLEDLLLGNNNFRSLPSLAGLSKLKFLCLNACRRLLAIPDLPTNLYVLKAICCPNLETIPDFSKMWNMRELYLSDSFKLTEVPGLDKSLNSMTRIHMDGCTNLTADFRKNILQGWTSCGYGGIFLSGNDIPDWFHCVHDDDIVYFTVPQSVGRILKGLTLSFVCSSAIYGCHISIKNMTKGTELDSRIAPFCPIKGYYLWQGQLSNDELKLQDGDKVLIEIRVRAKEKVKKTGVSLVWDKVMNENMIDYHLWLKLCLAGCRLTDLAKSRWPFKAQEVPGLDKSLNSMTRIHMEGCTNLTADFRNNILQRWTSCGFGGIYLNVIYDIPEWFKIVNHVDSIVFFEVLQRIMGRDLKGLTMCFVYSSDRPKLEDSQVPIDIIVRNLTKQTALHTKIAFASLKPEDDSSQSEDDYLWQSNEPEDHYLWQGQLSNDVLHLEGGDHISILVSPNDVDFVRVKKTGVHLEWDKVMKENMDNPDPHLGVDGAFFGGSVIHEQLAVEPYLDFFGETDNEARRSHDARPDDGAGRSHDTFVRTNQSSAVDEQLALELMSPFQEFQEIVVTDEW
ncbi:unnamed protein product [Prunus armeniaca]